MFDRQKLIHGITFIGIGIVVLIVAMWLEPMLNVSTVSQWVVLVIRIVALICIVAGFIYSIIAFIPKDKR